MTRLNALALAIGISIFGAVASAAPKDAHPATQGDALKALALETRNTFDVTWSQDHRVPRILHGVLTPSSNAAASDTAMAFLSKYRALFAIADPSTLVVDKVIRTAAGHVVRIRQQVQGVPVVGGAVTVRVDRAGRVRQVVNGYALVAGVGTDPAISAEDARDILLSDIAVTYPVESAEDIATRLVILPVPGNDARLCWELHTGAVPQLLSNWIVYVDALTGDILRRENRIWLDRRAWVFEQNPVSTPQEKEVQLDLPLDYVHPAPDAGIRTICDQDIVAKNTAWTCGCTAGECLWLSDPLFSSRNCIDLHEKVKNIHYCSQVQTAFGDGNDDFLYDPRLTDGGLDDLNAEDRFSEVQMYYHVNVVYDFFRSLSDRARGTDYPVDGDEWGGMKSVPLLATVNFRIPVKMAAWQNPSLQDLLKATNANGPLYPFENAMFMPGGSGGLPGIANQDDQIIFGQGSVCDFSWDGDVIYHEFTHGVTNSVAGGLGGWVLDDWGSLSAPAAMNEGFSDLFAAIITREPTMGEYAIQPLDPSKVRHLDNDLQCPWYFSGESHNDSKGWSGSLWDGLNGIAKGDRDKEIEVASYFFAAESMLVLDMTFDQAAEVFFQVTGDELGDEARQALLDGFAGHKMYKCERILDLDAADKVLPLLPVLSPSHFNLQNWSPAMAQYKKSIPAPGVASIRFEATYTGTAPKALVKTGERIVISYASGSASSDAQGPLDVQNPATNQYTLTYAPPGGITQNAVYVMFVNASQQQGTIGKVTATLGDPLPGNEDAGVDSGKEPDAGKAKDAGVGEENASSGCGCSTHGRPSRLPALSVAIDLLF